jgi:hypothetical protein
MCVCVCVHLSIQSILQGRVYQASPADARCRGKKSSGEKRKKEDQALTVDARLVQRSSGRGWPRFTNL